MPTKTKPRTPDDCFLVPVQIKENDRSILEECLNLDKQTDPDWTAEVISHIENVLTLQKNRMRHGLNRPLPTHIVAALKPIAEKAEELASLLDSGQLHIAVKRELNSDAINNGEIFMLLKEIALAANSVIHRQKSKPSSGMYKKVIGDLINSFNTTIEQIYRNIRPESEGTELEKKEYRDSKKEFLKICRKYMPRIPTQRKRSNIRKH